MRAHGGWGGGGGGLRGGVKDVLDRMGAHGGLGGGGEGYVLAEAVYACLPLCRALH